MNTRKLAKDLIDEVGIGPALIAIAHAVEDRARGSDLPNYVRRIGDQAELIKQCAEAVDTVTLGYLKGK